MKIKNIKINNILSIEEAELSFDERGLVLIEGYDYDSGRANGAGKSAIFNALSFALYDQIPRKINKTEIVRRGANSAYVEVELEIEGDTYKVRRERPASCHFFKADLPINITQSEFESKMGLNYEQFLITTYSAQDSSERFLHLNDRGKKEFLLKLMNLGDFNSFKKKISENVSKIKTELEVLKTKKDGYHNAINIYNNQIVDLSQTNSKINTLEQDIKDITQKISEYQNISEPDVSKYLQIEKQAQENLLKLQSIKISQNIKRNELKSLQALSPEICPDCGVNLSVVNGKIIKSNNKKIIDDQITLLKKEIDDNDKQLLKEIELNALLEKIRNKKIEDYKEYNNALAIINEYKNSIIVKNKDISLLKELVLKNSQFTENIDKLKTNVLQCESKLNDLKEEKQLLDTISSFFDPTGLSAYIMDNIIDSLNESMADYISYIWSNASYLLQTFKENKDGTVSTKFSETLLINGAPTLIGSLSGGELRALSLSVDFAIIDILKNKFSIDVNIMVLDEAFNGLDATGKELIIDLLQKISVNKQILVIDHSCEFKSHFDNLVRVEKRNGVSSIVNTTV